MRSLKRCHFVIKNSKPNPSASCLSPEGGSEEPGSAGQGRGHSLARFAEVSRWVPAPRTVCVFTRKAFFGTALRSSLRLGPRACLLQRI